MMLFGACAVDPTGTGDDTFVGGGGVSGDMGGGGSMLPAELVGTWQSIESDAAISYQFTADGEVVYAGDLETNLGCPYQTETEYEGTVTLSGTTITLTPVQGEQDTDDCGATTQQPFTKVEVDAYEVQSATLLLHNQATGVTLTLSKR
jgi:hypothetical protein